MYKAKLHLGCGERYFDGYKNIDFPPSEHTVQQSSKADEYQNLLEMKIDSDSIDEVRLHHVFEHFDRPTSVALLFAWNKWLKSGGVLHIEVPDYFWTGVASLCPFVSNRKRLVAIRHIFGSHEAAWAIHCEGWTKKNLESALGLAGFKVVKTKRSYWRGTFNLELIAVKNGNGNINNVPEFFRQYTLDESSTEKMLLKTWLEKFSSQYSKMIK